MRSLAENASATDAERDTARRIMAKYIATYGAEVDIPDEEARAEARVTFDGRYEDALATHCGRFTGCTVYNIGQVKWAGTARERFVAKPGVLKYEGPKTSVAMAVELFEHHKAKLNAYLDLAENTYRFGAMPIASAGTNYRKMTPEEVDVMDAMRAAGKANAMHRALPSGR